MQVQPRPRRLHVDLHVPVRQLCRAQQLHRDARHQRLHQRHDVVVVRVRLVALHRGELGIVRGVESLVAEDAPDLVHPVQPADDAPLEVELRSDAKVERPAERVVLRDEWPSVGPRRDAQQDRRLNFKVVPRVHEAPDRRHQLAPQHKALPHVVVRDQVRLALPEPLLHVLQPVPLLRRWSQRLAEHRRRARLHRRLARPRVNEPPTHAEKVAQVQRLQQLKVRAGDVAPKLRLHRAGAVAQVQERDAPHVPHARNATRHADHALPAPAAPSPTTAPAAPVPSRWCASARTAPETGRCPAREAAPASRPALGSKCRVPSRCSSIWQPASPFALIPS